MKKNKRIGLALSGGGYRATIYHLGTLKKLKELDLLDSVDVISTSSGGSITGAAFGIYGDDFERFERVVKKGVKSSVIKGIVTAPLFLLLVLMSLTIASAIVYFLFTSFAWISLLLFVFYWIILFFFHLKIFPIGILIERTYNKIFFHNKCLSDLSDKKTVAINATNLETGTLFTFSREKMGDTSYSHLKEEGKSFIFKHKNFPIARAVAASTCIPFVFSPIKIGKEFYVDQKNFKRANPLLVDGGVYDNQGIHKIAWTKGTNHCDTIIVSDAGNEIPLINHTNTVFTNSVKNFQMIQLMYNRGNDKEVVYQSLDWNVEDPLVEFIKNIKNGVISKDVINAHGIVPTDIQNNEWDKIKEKLIINIQYDKIIKNANSEEQMNIAWNISTNLMALKDDQISALINHASVMTELQIKLYCPSLFE